MEIAMETFHIHACPFKVARIFMVTFMHACELHVGFIPLESPNTSNDKFAWDSVNILLSTRFFF